MNVKMTNKKGNETTSLIPPGLTENEENFLANINTYVEEMKENKENFNSSFENIKKSVNELDKSRSTIWNFSADDISKMLTSIVWIIVGIIACFVSDR